MKGIALMLSLLVLSIVAIPAINFFDRVEDEKHSCCVADQNSENPSKDDCCENGCNPFINCCGMMGFVPKNQFQFQITKVEVFDQISDHCLDPISDCDLDIWHPPKV